ncbi:MAG: DUF6785 family protein [Phycisphaerae bacterium]
MKLSHLATMIVGLVLICLLVPTTQYLTRNTVNLDIETGVPVGWAIGLILSFAIVLAVIKLIARTRILDRSNLVILYAMLTVAVPVMNLGLIRPMFLNMQVVNNEYLFQATSTYRTAYAVQDPAWFPVVPTLEGLAYNQMDVVITRLDDIAARNQRRMALKTITDAMTRLEKGLTPIEEADFTPGQAPEPLLAAVDKLWVDQIDNLMRGRQKQYVEQLGLTEAIQQRRAQAIQASEKALAALGEQLRGIDEFALSRVSEFWKQVDYSALMRIEAFMRDLPAERRQEINQLAKKYEAQVDTWRNLMGQLSLADRQRLLMDLAAYEEQQLRQLSDEELTDKRVSFTFRSSQAVTKSMLYQDGTGGQPDMNIQAFHETLWPQQTAAQSQRSVSETLEDSAEMLPWHLYKQPMIMWGILFVTIFLLMMCLAEYFRRKWIERENLAFPLVEIADNIIRHDCALEMAEEATDSPPRSFAFSPVFLVGFAIGALWISMEALSHYQFGDMGSSPKVTVLNMSKDWFKEGVMKEMNKVFFILSPIVVGIAFLVSLEITFSVWVMFFIYTVLGVLIKTNIAEAMIKPAGEVGWAAGKLFPFPSEQMLGAALCFTLILVIKSIRTHTPPKGEGKEDSFVPRKLNFVGMVVLPLLILGLLWHMGVSSLALLILFAAIVMVQTIAAARVRAETGLPTFHSSYEMTKAPIIFGLTGISGAKAFAAYVHIVFLPATLLFRSLSTHLENMELARRNRVRLRTIAIASLIAFVVAISVGMISFLVFTHAFGGDAYGSPSAQGNAPDDAWLAMRYPLWVSHFLTEARLGKFDNPLTLRFVVMGIGFGVFGLLSFLRNRFLRFPLHPMGYLLLMMGIYYNWASNYVRGSAGFGTNFIEAPLLWGSVFVAWLIKKLVIKYGGMNTYKKAKPLFIGLVVGSIFCIFAWDMVHLVAGYMAETAEDPSDLLRKFQETYPYTPKFY